MPPYAEQPDLRSVVDVRQGFEGWRTVSSLSSGQNLQLVSPVSND